MKFNIKVEVNVSENRETLVNNITNYNSDNFKKLTKEEIKETIKKRTTYMTKEAYNASNWKNKTLIYQYLEKYN